MLYELFQPFLKQKEIDFIRSFNSLAFKHVCFAFYDFE